MQQQSSEPTAETDAEAEGAEGSAPVAASSGTEAGSWTQHDFNAWKKRMGLKTHPETAAALRVSDETARSYAKGRKPITAQTVMLCGLLEKLRAYEAGTPAGASDAEMVRLLAQAYAGEVRARRPMAAMTMDVKGVERMLGIALAKLGLVLAREQDVETAA